MPWDFTGIDPLARAIEALNPACLLCDATALEHPERCYCWCHDHAFMQAEARRLRIQLTYKTSAELRALAERVEAFKCPV